MIVLPFSFVFDLFRDNFFRTLVRSAMFGFFYFPFIGVAVNISDLSFLDLYLLGLFFGTFEGPGIGEISAIGTKTRFENELKSCVGEFSVIESII